ncbi:hypothetical protein BDV98DRAFT_609155 [Pterulicium gracile]|uniref:Uncharacterized protein n=1 Tax=Pterulicium gracile TaxID=1884261 RepID=A0A5C3PZU5_9AGAR|nr:hypothetical protein BDV98DRAFT_609155 [Pterula gracilis]
MLSIKALVLVSIALISTVLAQDAQDEFDSYDRRSPYYLRPTKKPHRYRSCGGRRIETRGCPRGYVCVDDPYVGGCGMACDAPGICVKPNTFCGGFAGFRCKGEKRCVDNSSDDCSSLNGGADCGGICV